MADAPDRIWAEEIGTATKGGQSFRIGRWITDETASHSHEYIRADVARTDAELAVAEAIRRAGKLADNWQNDTGVDIAAAARICPQIAPADALAEVQRLRARLEDAEAAQALVVERAVEAGAEGAQSIVRMCVQQPTATLEYIAQGEIRSRIRALAPASGVETLAALRAARDEWKRKHGELQDLATEHNTAVAQNTIALTSRTQKAEAERDAALARVEKLRGETFYIDCKFDGHNGPLLSIAMVREDGWSVHITTDATAEDPWVIENVLPIMVCHQADNDWRKVRLDEVGTVLRGFIGDCQNPVIIADSPVDIGRFCSAISTGEDGGWASADYPSMTFIVHNVNCYPTSLDGAIQHNAWWDAMALRAALDEDARHG